MKRRIAAMVLAVFLLGTLGACGEPAGRTVAPALSQASSSETQTDSEKVRGTLKVSTSGESGKPVFTVETKLSGDFKFTFDGPEAPAADPAPEPEPAQPDEPREPDPEPEPEPEPETKPETKPSGTTKPSTTAPSKPSSGGSSGGGGSGGGNGNANNFDTWNVESQQDTQDSWVLNTSSLKIHYPSCNQVPKIAPKNYATSSKTESELLNDGYTTCGVCHK